MKEIILVIIASIFAAIYNAILLIVHMESTDGKLETTSELLTILNMFKDAVIVAKILFNIFLG